LASQALAASSFIESLWSKSSFSFKFFPTGEIWNPYDTLEAAPWLVPTVCGLFQTSRSSGKAREKPEMILLTVPLVASRLDQATKQLPGFATFE